MTATAGYENRVYILVGDTPMDGSTGALISGVNSTTYEDLVEALDVTSFGDLYKKRIFGLGDVSFSLEGKYIPDDANGQKKLRARTYAYVGIYQNGEEKEGVQFPVLITKFSLKADASGTQDISIGFEGNGEPITLPVRTI